MATRGPSADCLTLRASALATRGPSADYLRLRDPYPLLIEVSSPIPRLLQDVNSIAVEFRSVKGCSWRPFIASDSSLVSSLLVSRIRLVSSRLCLLSRAPRGPSADCVQLFPGRRRVNIIINYYRPRLYKGEPRGGRFRLVSSIHGYKLLINFANLC